jgi:hypothetical protein
MASAESIMKTINSLPHEQKWTLIHSLERSFEKEKQKMHDESEPIVHYEAVIETEVEPEEYRSKDGDMKPYKLKASDYKWAREIMTDCSCWIDFIKRAMEDAHVARGKALAKARGVLYPYCGSYNVPLKNFAIKLNKTESDKVISITLSWDSWQIEDCYIENELSSSLIDCAHFIFNDYEFDRFRFSYEFKLKSLDYEEPSQESE